MSSEIIKLCSEKTNTWLWFMDYLHNVTSEILNHVKYATFASATSSDVVTTFKEFNSNSYWIIEGYDPEIMYPEQMTYNNYPYYKYNIVFIGNATSKRIEQLRGKDIQIFGTGWPKEFNANSPVYQHEYRKVVCQSKLSLNLVHGNIFSNRVVDSLACGTRVISEYCKDLHKVFPAIHTIDSINDINTKLLSIMDVSPSLDTNLGFDTDTPEPFLPWDFFGTLKDLERYTWENVLKKIVKIVNNGDCR